VGSTLQRASMAVAATFLIVAAGCSSSSKSSSSSSSAAGASTTAPAATSGASGAIPTATEDSAAAALVPAAIKSKGSITYALDATYAPDEFVAADGHTIVGMDADLSVAISQVLGLKANLVNATFDTIIPGLLSGKYDVGNSSFTDTKAREAQVDFVDYFSAGEGFYEAANNSTAFNGLASLCGHKVSVESGTTEQTDAQTQAKACTTAGMPTVTVLTFQDQNGANLAVSSGRAEVGFADSQVAAYIVSQSNGQFKNTGTAFETAPYGIAMPKNGLAPAILAAIKDLMSDGIYTQILTKWGVQAGAITNPVINGATS